MMRILLEHQQEIVKALQESLILIGIPLMASIMIGLPLGTLIFLSKSDGLKPNKILYGISNLYVNIVRSVPFLIFVIAIRPLTILIMGRFLGTLPATLPLSLIAVALFARYVEAIPQPIVDTAISMGATTPQIIRHFLYVEGKPSLILGLTASTISVISYSTVIGVVGGGGIGDFAMRYGYQAFNYPLMYTIVIIIFILVQIIQYIGATLASYLDKT